MFRWLLVGTMAWCTVCVTWNHASASGRPGIGVPIFGAAALVDMVLNVLLLSRLGVVGAGVAAVISYWLAAILFLRSFCRREHCTLREALVIQPSDVRYIVELLAEAGRRMLLKESSRSDPVERGDA